MEWFLIGISTFVVAVLCFQLRSVSRLTGTMLLLCLGATLITAKFWQDKRLNKLVLENQHERSLPREGRPGGYVTSDSCQACHPNEHASWHMSYHRTMTQYASPESVRGNFDHPPLEHLASPIKLERKGDEYWVELEDPDFKAKQRANPDIFAKSQPAPRVERRIGMLTGSHHLQVYWVPSEKGNLQHIFPYAYLFEGERWVPFKDTFLRDPQSPSYTQLWNMNCMNCHATAGQSRPDMRSRTVDTRTGELGIACEACHGPAEEHVAYYRNPINRYQADRTEAPDPTIVNPAKLDARRSSMVCGQCHGITWISDSGELQQHGIRFRPGDELNLNRKLIRAAHLDEQPILKESLKNNPRYLSDRYWSDGMVRVSGRDYSGMMESPCHLNGELSCLSCHSLHHDSPKTESALEWRDDQLSQVGHSNQACTQCHESIATDLEAHTHHPVESTGSHCYNCHMPHTTYGLLKAIRSHHIDSPSVQSSLDTGRPNACNLCHLDQTLEWTGQHLTDWFGQPRPALSNEQRDIAAGLTWVVKGEAGQRALLAWHFGWDAAKEASGQDWMGFAVAQGLVDPYSAVRFISQRSLKRLEGMEDLDYDFIGPESERLEAMQRARGIWASQTQKQSGSDRSNVLINADGNPNRERFNELIRNRDNRSMDLQE
jgi:hypothetical protein